MDKLDKNITHFEFEVDFSFTYLGEAVFLILGQHASISLYSVVICRSRATNLEPSALLICVKIINLVPLLTRSPIQTIRGTLTAHEHVTH